MSTLSFATVSGPQGLINGRFSPWVVQWQLPPGTPNGFVLQHMQVQFQGVHYCYDDDFTDDEIWNIFGYQGETRLQFWEAWQFQDGVWQRPGNTDGWGFSRPGTFYSNDGEGVVVFKGSAGFYEAQDLNQFCDAWGSNGDNSGSPMSGDLMSTTLLDPSSIPPGTVNRSMTVEWRCCGCDSDDQVCRRTVVTTAIGPVG